MSIGGSLSIRQIEAATLTAWPAITTAMDGSWLARLARGYSKRSNSIQCLDPTDDGDAAARLARLCDLYPLNSLDPVFRVTPLAGPGVIAALDADGWGAPFDETRVLEMSLASVPDVPDNVEILEGTDRKWVRTFVDLANLDRRPAEIFATILNLIACRNAGVFIRDARGEPVAAALAVNALGIGVYHNVLVRPDARGKGFGRLVIQAALAWSRDVGATNGAIQVVSDNTPAVNLYTSLGFSEAYRYHYRRPN